MVNWSLRTARVMRKRIRSRRGVSTRVIGLRSSRACGADRCLGYNLISPSKASQAVSSHGRTHDHHSRSGIGLVHERQTNRLLPSSCIEDRECVAGARASRANRFQVGHAGMGHTQPGQTRPLPCAVADRIAHFAAMLPPSRSHPRSPRLFRWIEAQISSKQVPVNKVPVNNKMDRWFLHRSPVAVRECQGHPSRIAARRTRTADSAWGITYHVICIHPEQFYSPCAHPLPVSCSPFAVTFLNAIGFAL
ncbi:hypothetical protein C8R46DRAFT_380005 [Mycena filopes]|nr:hypothetical protein C8R46DRAFT_380005 [Mycena filopes]